MTPGVCAADCGYCIHDAFAAQLAEAQVEKAMRDLEVRDDVRCAYAL